MNPFKLDNRGITLVELLTSMAVASILFVGVMAFMNAGTRGYTTSSNETTLQDDVQDILNYLYDITICSTDVHLYSDSSTDILCILAPDNSSKSVNNSYFLHYLCFDNANNSLYYKKNTETASNITSASVEISAGDIIQDVNLLANNVTKFRTSVRRKADFEAVSSAPGDSFVGGIKSDGDDANSVSLVSYSITVNDGNKNRTADVAVRPRNMMDSKLSFYGLFGTPAPTAPSGVVSPTST